MITRRWVSNESRPQGGGIECFETEAALAINEARLNHLASLGLPLSGRRVLEVGAGIGELTGFFLDRGCDVVATEARPENVEALRRRRSEADVRIADVERSLVEFGRFDVVFCYGVLYHLENPLLALRNMAVVCDELLLVETMVCDSKLPILRLEDEPTSVNQALRGLAHRPSPAYLALALNRIGFEHVYVPREPPDHPDYRFTQAGDLRTSRDGALLRGVFVASRAVLATPTLTSLPAG